jgi:hypothetical protein
VLKEDQRYRNREIYQEMPGKILAKRSFTDACAITNSLDRDPNILLRQTAETERR